MREHLRILELAAKGSLPRTIDSASDLPIEVVQELIEAGHLKAIDASSHDGLAYLEPKITLTGREYLAELTSRKMQDKMQRNEARIRLFISHSNRDSALVELLVAFLRAALNLPASQIRCTSIDGYRLPAGANTDEQLRREVNSADAFIGIISSESLKSLYVAFELGARWGVGRPLFPLLSPGTDARILDGPLAGLNALSAGNRAQLQQLVTDLARTLEIRPEVPASYERDIDSIVNLKIQPSSEHNDGSIHSSPEELAEKETQILRLVAEHSDHELQLKDIAQAIQENHTRAEHYVDHLLDEELLHDSLSMGGQTTYGLTKKGRAYLAERRFI